MNGVKSAAHGGNLMKTAVITGASSGMGRELTIQLAARGEFDEMWLIARRADRLEELCRQLPCKARVLALDLTDAASFDSYAAALAAEQPQVTLLANCSGFGKFGGYADIPLADKVGMIDLNAKATVMMIELTLPFMPRGARIINLDSLSAFQPVPYLNVYAATKAFVLSYSRAMNAELHDRGISVTAVCPGWVKTEFFDRAEKTSTTAVTYFNHVYLPQDVIHTAVRDAYKRKAVSVHGAAIKRQVFLVKLLPHSLVMRIWLHQQKHK